ncbi:MAG: hypothetical protein WCF77_03415 [Minisyncoccia bacterium]|jgi:hypothetical protein
MIGQDYADRKSKANVLFGEVLNELKKVMIGTPIPGLIRQIQGEGFNVDFSLKEPPTEFDDQDVRELERMGIKIGDDE